MNVVDEQANGITTPQERRWQRDRLLMLSKHRTVGKSDNGIRKARPVYEQKDDKIMDI